MEIETRNKGCKGCGRPQLRGTLNDFCPRCDKIRNDCEGGR